MRLFIKFATTSLFLLAYTAHSFDYSLTNNTGAPVKVRFVFDSCFTNEGSYIYRDIKENQSATVSNGYCCITGVQLHISGNDWKNIFGPLATSCWNKSFNLGLEAKLQ